MFVRKRVGWLMLFIGLIFASWWIVVLLEDPEIIRALYIFGGIGLGWLVAILLFITASLPPER